MRIDFKARGFDLTDGLREHPHDRLAGADCPGKETGWRGQDHDPRRSAITDFLQGG